ncbi:MCE family protein [Nocardia sp. 2]|uniref:MCE family protein n=1 Tax=Nocardia acididurans TaxID=2802282 RepID=A0ABS1M4Q4_9NOCA|nr:MlaD family protein [Nocardia acididurans]MBL1075536.1 MCE family protein [Nocardia acididurans]
MSSGTFQSRRALAGFGLFAVIAIVLTYTIWSTLQRSVPGGTHSYSAVFSDVLGLRIGDDIRMAGVRVGRVDKIDFTDGYRARVDFRIEDDQHLTTSTKALVRYQNLIGQRYIALMPGKEAGVPLETGGQIPIERTEPSFDVSALLSGFEPLFSVLQPDQINSLSETLIQALQGNNVSLSALITQAAQLAATFGQRDQILGDVVANLSSVMAGLANRSGELETLITQTRALTESLYAQGEVLKSSVDRVATATDSLVNIIAQVKPGAAQAQTDATAGIALLLMNGASLDQAAVELPEVLNAIARFSSYGTYGNAYICRLDVSLWGVLFPPGLFSQIGGDSQSEVCR